MGLFGPNIAMLEANGDLAGLRAARLSPKERIRIDCNAALGRIARSSNPLAEDALAALIDGIWSPGSDAESETAIAAIAACGDRAVDPLDAHMRAHRSAVNGYREATQAALILGEVGTERAVEALLGELEPLPPSPLAGAIVTALARAGWTPGADAVSAKYWAAQSRWDMCLQLGEVALPALVSALSYVALQGGAAAALAQMGTPAVSPIAAVLRRGTAFERQGAVKAAQGLGAAGVIALVAPLDRRDLAPKDLAPVMEALKAMVDGIFDHKDAELLAEALGDAPFDAAKLIVPTLDKLGWVPTPDAAGAAYWAVHKSWQKCVEIGSPAVPILMSALDSPACAQAAEALGQICDERCVDRLIREVRSDFTLTVYRVSAAKALVEIYRATPDASVRAKILTVRHLIIEPYRVTDAHGLEIGAAFDSGIGVDFPL